MSHSHRVVIVGAGIGGLTAATALTKAGMDVTVLERAPTLDAISTGGGLVLWHNAVLALEELGLGDAIGAAGHELRSHEFRSARGPWLARWPVADMAVVYGAPAYAIQRSTLHRMLAEVAGGSLRFGARCLDVEYTPDEVVLHLADGTRVQADLCVGADGLRSTVRRALRGHEVPPRYAGYTAYQAVLHFPGRPVADGTFGNLWGRGLRFMYFRLDDEGTVYWDAVISDQVLAGQQAEPQPGRLLRRLFAGWPEPVEELINATLEEEKILAIDIHDRPPVTGWTGMRVALLGDAAHPMTFNLGQGACQAIEDALALTSSLRAQPDIATALRDYETFRHPRVSEIVRTSWLIGSIGRWRSRTACLARDAIMRATFNRIAMRKSYELMMDTYRGK